MAAKRPTVIEINGQEYDADTGQMLSKNSTTPPARTSPKVIDGFAPKRNPNTARSVHNKQQRSKTLQRNATNKPQPAQKTKVSVRNTGESSVSTKPGFHDLSHIPEGRAKRAQDVKRSSVVSKFASDETPIDPHAHQAPQPHPVPPAPREDKNHVATLPMHSKHALQPQQKKPEPQAEKEQKPGFFAKLRMREVKAVPVLASITAVLILAGYITYLNVPRFAMRVAASRAGIDADLPAFSPSGYSFDGPISYSSGQVTIQFASNTDDRTYQITQRESAWDSESLEENFVTQETVQYVTFQERGLTVYIYDGSNATWVDSGIWYTIEGDSKLSSEQLLRIASSL